MQTPEVWKFAPPHYRFNFIEGNLSEKTPTFSNTIASHFYNHLVSVTIPGNQDIDRIKAVLEEDSQYYLVEQIDIIELIRKEFIEAFIKRGHLTILSDGAHIDTDDCIALTPSGHLILSLQRQTYQELGIEGKASAFSPVKKATRFVIDLDLLAEHFTPGKKHYERIVSRLSAVHNLKFNLLLTWGPSDECICPSSIAAYLESRGYNTSLCQAQFQQRLDRNVRVPLLKSRNEGKECTNEELLEWLGAYSIGVNLSQDVDDTVDVYLCPDDNQLCDKFLNLQWCGFFCASKIKKLFEEIRIWICQQKEVPWASIHVQGFFDSPINWDLQEHYFYANGDNNFTIFVRPDNFGMMCCVTGSSKCPRKKK